MARKKKFRQQESDKFSGTIKEFVDLMQPALRLPTMVARGRWIIGQMLYVATRKNGVVITNTPF